ncbi:hypothetical protein LSH36_486g01006, partial [Paralvinella palmiformis]
RQNTAYQNLTNNIHTHSYKSHSSDYSSDIRRLTFRRLTMMQLLTYRYTHSSNYRDSRHTLTHTTATAR